MEQEPQRELPQYTSRRIALWLRLGGHLVFILFSVGAFVVVVASLIFTKG